VSDQNEFPSTAESALEQSRVDGVLPSDLYCGQPVPSAATEPARRGQKPTHYKVICISLYNEDLRRLDAMVDTLKARGMTKANRSALIRYALGEVDLESVPRGL
jgi:hypothetical protein